MLNLVWKGRGSTIKFRPTSIGLGTAYRPVKPDTLHKSQKTDETESGVRQASVIDAFFNNLCC